jgi:hypothetical protein
LFGTKLPCKFRICERWKHANPTEEVAKAILYTVTSYNIELIALVGNDIIMMMETKKSMSNEDFRRMMMQSCIG